MPSKPPRRNRAEPAEEAADQPQGPSLPVRNRYTADPAAAAPALCGQGLDKLTGCGYYRSAGMADLRPPVMRPGAEAARQFPSRRGDRLYWPGGRVTTLSGEVLA